MTKEKQEREIVIKDNRVIPELFGKLDENVNIIEEELDVEIVLREGKLIIIGGDGLSAELGVRLINKLIEIIESEKKLTKQNLLYTVQLILEGKEENIQDLLNDTVCITASGKTIKPKTLGQKKIY